MQGLSHKRNVNNETLKDLVMNELETSSSLLGYRKMTEILAVRYVVRNRRSRWNYNKKK